MSTKGVKEWADLSSFKECSKCKQTLPANLDYFSKNKRGKDNLHSICKECRNKQRREAYNQNKEHYNTKNLEYYYNNKEKWVLSNRKSCYKRKYNITIEQYNKILLEQNNKCKICGTENKEKYFHIDHNHKTGKIRGLLCCNCNLALGFIKDNSFILIKAINYLREY